MQQTKDVSKRSSIFGIMNKLQNSVTVENITQNSFQGVSSASRPQIFANIQSHFNSINQSQDKAPGVGSVLQKFR